VIVVRIDDPGERAAIPEKGTRSCLQRIGADVSHYLRDMK
jgi:hypothetical protein